MSKYRLLWEKIAECGEQKLILSFEEIRSITGERIDHSFLNEKKQLCQFGWEVEKVSLKKGTVEFRKKI